MENLISIIVPIYNVEKYLIKCLDSILSQTYSNLEIILVNDGSTDNCGKICDDYANIDSRIKVIHKQNGGLINAWKAGLTVIKGEYLGFVDSDDYIDKDMYELLMESMSKHNSDIAMCGVYNVYDNTLIKQNSPLEKDCYVGEDLDNIKSELLPTLESNGDIIKFFRWNKLFNTKQFITYLKYIDDKVTSLEDMTITFPYLLKCDCLSVVHKACYYYLQRESSMIHTTNVKENLKSIELAINVIKRECEDLNCKFDYRIDYFMANWILSMIEGRGNYSTIKSNCRYLREYSRTNDIPFDNKLMSKKNKIKAFMLKNKMYALLFLMLKINKIIG